MIPLRIYLKGFMCFRDPAEMHFDGAPLWMLTGNNGAGKSAVFDAILYALFGIHRKGTQNAHFIINKQSRSLEVEFDFAVGDDCFRVRRTLGRKGRPGFQAFERRGGRANESSSTWQAVTDSESRDALKGWVTRTIGIDERAFTSSVFLQQGKSEKLLTSDDKDRHEVLSQIIDLSKYQRIYERADDHRKNHKGQAEGFQSQLQNIAPVNADEIEALAAQVISAADTANEARGQREEIIRLTVHAQNWNRLQAELKDIEPEIKVAETLLAQSNQIERDAERFGGLQRALPVLREIFNERDRLAGIEQKIAEYNHEAAQYEKAKIEKAINVNEAQARFDYLSGDKERLRLACDDTQDKLSQLAPHLAELGQLRQARNSVDQLEGKLARIPVDLDEQVTALERSLRALNELRSSLPLLQNFMNARSAWRVAQKQNGEATTEIAGRTLELNHAITSEDNARRELVDQEATLATAERRKAEAQLLCKQIGERIQRLGQLDGCPTCEWCGQELTPQHLEAEGTRLNAEYLEAEAESKSAKDDWQRALANHKAQQEKLHGLSSQKAEVRRRLDRAEATLEFNRTNQEQAIQQGQTALSSLRAEYRSQTPWAEADDVTQCFLSLFPTDEDLKQRRLQVKRIHDEEQQLIGLRNQKSERDAILAQRRLEFDKVATLETKYSAERELEITQAYERATAELKHNKQTLTDLETETTTAALSLAEAIKQAEENDSQLQRATQEANVAVARSQELRERIRANEGSLEASWREPARFLTLDQLERWTQEAESLSEAHARLQQLRVAREQQAIRKARQLEIKREIAGIDPRAQCAVVELDAQESVVRKKYDEAERLRRDAENRKRTLEERMNLRRDLEEQRLSHAQKAELFKQLAVLLGKDNLQRHLLSQAESSIVNNANNVLDRISSGTLRLELNQADDDGLSRTKGGSKALDLLASFSGTGVDALPVDFLSGSQRFRVAVSLALGIGQYASHGSRRIESVILDEGFGSLDKQGCSEMISELQRLKDVLGRIILVSHQEEVADAFPNNKYLVQIVDGTSQVSLVEDLN
jgi:DNA repair protein SbcC/Rad50